MKKTNYGYFIVIEGCDGSGKTTVAKLLRDKLAEEGYDAYYTREPGGTEVGNKIRDFVLHNKVSSTIATLLFAASMNANISEFIKPAVEQKKIVICDRFVRSTYIYQGFSKQKPGENAYQYAHRTSTFNEIERYACENIIPDIEFILDVKPRIAWDRTHTRNIEIDVFEAEGYKAFEERAKAYLNAMGDEVYYGNAYELTYELHHVDANYAGIDSVVNECYKHIINRIDQDNKIKITKRDKNDKK
jgi:dTMP kinase